MTGLDNTEDFVEKTNYDLVLKPEKADFYRESKAREMQVDTQEFHLVELSLKADNAHFRADTNKFLQENPEGNVVGMLGNFDEITEQQQTLQALEESEERFRFLAEFIPQQVWIAQANGSIEYVNKLAVNFLACSREQVLDWQWQQWVHPEDLPRCLLNWKQSLATGNPMEIEVRLLRGSDKVYRWYLIRALPLRDRQGKILNWFGTNTDIDERVSAEVALRHSEERFRNLVEASSDLVWEINENAVYTYVSPKVQEILGYECHELIGKTPFDLMPPEEAKRIIAFFDPILAARQPFKCLHNINIHQDGHLVVLESSGVPVFDVEGKFCGYRGIDRDITARKQAEESLLRFRTAIDSTSDAILILDITGRDSYLNPAFTELYGYTLEELQAAGGAVVIFQEPGDYGKILTALVDGISWRGEVTMQTSHGQTVQVYLRSDAIKDATGKIVGTVCIHTDITQRKQAEECLRLRDRAIAASSNSIIIADASIANGAIIYVNPAFEQMTGYCAAEVIGQNFRSFPGADIDQLGIQQLNAAIQAGKDCTIIFRNHRKDGSLLWNELNISPVYDQAGALTHYIGIQTDITERKQAELDLLVSQQRLQYLLSSSPAVIYACKPHGNFSAIFISENVTNMMGYAAKEFLADSSFWLNHIHPGDLPNVCAKLSNLIEQEEYCLEYRFLHQDGSYRWVYDQGKVVWDDAGNPLECVGYWADITTRKQLEQELRVALEKEKELNELKSRFISMTSHEFRTPLSTILSSSELLEHYSHKWTKEKQITHLHRIQAAVKRMTEMLNDVLMIGKGEAGKLEFRPKYFDLVAYCRQLVEETQLYLSNKVVIFSTPHDNSMPCYMDDKLLSHILSNLLSNAIKYSLDNSIVKFTLTCENEQAIFKIQDWGIGIPSEDIPRLFESFHRARNVGNILGTGLGLAITKKCVDIHQGKISVSSTLGVGTLFTVILPLNSSSQIEVI